MARVLVTGAFGQIGSELVPALQAKFGKDNVVAIGHRNIPADFDGIVEKADASDFATIKTIMEKYNIDTLYHLVSLLSATGEANPNLAWDLNLNGLKGMLDLAVEKKLRVFWPSSIAAFGPTTPREMTPQRTVLEPTTMYGVTKVAGELLCQYYWKKYGLDVRSVRYPGIISWKAEPGGGTTDFAVAVFYEALQKGHYTCFVRPDTVLPMMYMDDAVRATLALMDADPTKLTVRTSYNLGAMSFSAEELVKEMQKQLSFTIDYKPDHRQAIADSWPKSVDDSVARADWGWAPEFELNELIDVMIQNLKVKFGK